MLIFFKSIERISKQGKTILVLSCYFPMKQKLITILIGFSGKHTPKIIAT